MEQQQQDEDWTDRAGLTYANMVLEIENCKNAAGVSSDRGTGVEGVDLQV